MSLFEDFLAPFLRTRGAKKDLAKKAGMTASGFGRGLDAGTLNAENLLQLARELALLPSAMLRAAGKTQLADLIEQLYGQANPRATTDEEWELIQNLRAMSPSKRLAAKDFIDWQADDGHAQQRSPRGLDKRSAKRKVS